MIWDNSISRSDSTNEVWRGLLSYDILQYVNTQMRPRHINTHMLKILQILFPETGADWQGSQFLALYCLNRIHTISMV